MKKKTYIKPSLVKAASLSLATAADCKWISGYEICDTDSVSSGS